MWVVPERIGAGVGRALFEHAVRQASLMQASFIDITADPHAESLYQRMGARRVGEVVSELDGRRRVLPRLVCEISSE